MLFFFILQCVCILAQSRCIWHSPTVLFPERLVRLDLRNDTFMPQRRLSTTIYQISKEDEKNVQTVTGTTSERNADLSIHPNAKRGEQYVYNEYTEGLDDQGRSHYTLIFDKRYAISGHTYSFVAAEPESLFHSIDLSMPGEEIVLVRFTHELATALEYRDVVKIWMSVTTSCLPPGREIARIPYDFNVTATYDLYHKYENSLVSNATQKYTPLGWVADASVVMHPSLSWTSDSSRQRVSSPCAETWFNTSIQVVNSSQYTYWDRDTETYHVSTKFIGNTTSIPRCHRREHGNVCSVITRARLNFRYCQVPVAFSLTHSVSQIIRSSPKSYTTPQRPNNFDARRRHPVLDGNDTRYDMCETRMCQTEQGCTPVHIENSDLMHDGAIVIEQHDRVFVDGGIGGTNYYIGHGYMETVCRFEVVGFLDDVWSPHIYFRQWVGYNYTLL